jgi:hypothetical protein
MLVPGVLPGSKGPLLYPPDEVRKSPEDWNHIPIVVYHPMKDGKPVSARSPSILSKHGIGVVFHARTDGKDILKSEGWLDVEATRRVDKSVLDSVQLGKPIELSTGLFVDDEPAPEGAIFNDHRGSRKYVGIARNYKPDHLAILPSGKGACSLADGCGVLINRAIRSGRLARSRSMPDKLKAWQKIGEALGLVEEVTNADVTANEPSFMEINRKLGDELFKRFGKGGNDNGLKSIDSSGGPYVVDVYDEYVVYEQNGAIYRIGYKVNNETNEVELDGDPQEVTRVVSYEPITHQDLNPTADPPSLTPDPSVTPSSPPDVTPDPTANAKKMPSKQAEVDPEKACKIIKDGGVHDASGKWRPLTQAQRGMFGAICGQRKGKKPTTHEEEDPMLVNAWSDAAREASIRARQASARAPTHGAGGKKDGLLEDAHKAEDKASSGDSDGARAMHWKLSRAHAVSANRVPRGLLREAHLTASRAHEEAAKAHEIIDNESPTEIVDGTPLDESLTLEDIVAMYDASPQAPNQTNEEHVLALASVAERINGAARHPETGQFTSPEATNDIKPPKSLHLGEHSSTAYEATKRVKAGKGPASDSISYSTAAYGYAVAGDHVSAAKTHRKAATAHSKAYSNLREDNTERTLHKAAENLHRAAARAHALLAGGPTANSEFTDTWADESDPLYGLTTEEVRDSLAELCGRQVTESVRESAILF